MAEADEDRNGGWASSAAAWIADMADTGDWGRGAVLDGAMLAAADEDQPPFRSSSAKAIASLPARAAP